MAREKGTQNPATAALKQQKTASIKKQKAQIIAQRTAKLARRNPDRLQKQIDELEAQKQTQGGKLRPKDTGTLEGLVRDLGRVRKAREVELAASGGGRAWWEGGGENGSGVLGKRSRGEGEGDRKSGGRRPQYGDRNGNHDNRHRDRNRNRNHTPTSDAEPDTDPDVRTIPMPRDTPPPIPPRRLRENRNSQPRTQSHNSGTRRGLPSQSAAFRSRPSHDDDNFPPYHDFTSNADNASTPSTDLPQRAQAKTAAKTTYTSAPVLRDLRKEAVSRFMPAAVAAKVKAAKETKEARVGGVGTRLLEPGEVDALEAREAEERELRRDKELSSGPVVDAGRIDEDEDAALRALEEEDRRFDMVPRDSPAADTEADADAARARSAAIHTDMNMDISKDIEGVADEMEKEAEFRVMAQGVGTTPHLPIGRGGLVDYGDSDDEDAEAEVSGVVEKQLRQVEMEEVEDEDL